MISSSFAPKFLRLLVAALAVSTSTAFQVSRSPFHLAPAVGGRTAFSMSADPIEEKRRIGPSEQLLLDAKERRDRRDRGHVQRVGKTIRGDGLDGVRVLVWSAFGASNYVFGGLAALLFVKLALTMAGYGVYLDTSGSFVVQTLEHIRQDQFFAAEAATRLVADASEGVKNHLS